MKRYKNNFEFSLSNVIDEETEMFPLMSNEDEEQINTEPTPKSIPILPLRNTVLFPGVIIPITIGRDRSIKLIKETYKTDKIIGVLAQKDGPNVSPKAPPDHQILSGFFDFHRIRMYNINITNPHLPTS